MIQHIRHILSYPIRKYKWYFAGGKQRAEEFTRQRAINQQHCYDFPPENNRWSKVGDTPVYGSIETNTIFDPYVFEKERILFLVASERKNNSIIRLESTDGIHWNNRITLLERKSKTWQHLVNRATVLYHNGLWHMWYTGQSPQVSSIAHTTSKDLLHFENATSPCLKAELPQEGVSVMNPCVIWNEEKQLFQMWYAAGENYEPDVLFYAESKDGDHWVKHPEPILTKYTQHEWEQAKVGGCDVKINADGMYEMYYIGYQNVDVARICYAISMDGIHWDRPENNLILSPTKNAWDADACYKPTFIDHQGIRLLWYNGRKDIEEYIGLAKLIV